MSLMRTNLNKIQQWGVAATVAWSLVAPGLSAAELNVYSHRHYEVDQRINERFTELTGIEVRVVNAEADQLIERLKSEGANSPADLLVTVDAGRMQRAREEGLLKPLESEVLDEATPEALRDPEGYWYPYTLRARIILAAKDRVGAGEITRYEDLAKPKWRGRLLIRSSSSSYNQALLASMVAAHGEKAAKDWAAGVVNNLARPPQGGDRDQIRAVAAGLADACVVNSYYLGLLLNSPDPDERRAAEKMRVIFPNQQDRGTHCNVTAAGLVKHAENIDEARKYLEFLVSPEVQKLIANESYEFPVGMDFTLSPTHKSWGGFEIDTETFPELGEHYPTAVRIFDAVGWK